MFGRLFVSALDLSRIKDSSDALYRLFTYSLLHLGALYFFFNAIFIAIYGFLLEPRIGSFRTLVSVVAGVFAFGLVHLATAPPDSVMVGGLGMDLALIGGWAIYWARFHSIFISWKKVVGAVAAVIGVLLVILQLSYQVPGSQMWIGQLLSVFAGVGVVCLGGTGRNRSTL